MTEKRFTNVEVDDYYNLICVNDGDTFHSYSEKALEDLLNELSDEYKQLKEDNEYLEKRFKEEEWHYDHIDEDRDAWRYKCQELEKENEELKLLVQNWEALDEEKDEQLDRQNQALKKLKKENEQLKADKQSLIDFIKKEFPKSHKHILEGFND